jgi:polygalacturonase
MKPLQQNNDSHTTDHPTPARNGHWVNILDTGALANHQQTSTAAIQRAIDLCSEAGGGTVFIPAGKFRSGTLWMRSNITLHLDSGAHLQGVAETDAYPIWETKWEGRDALKTHAPLIGGEGLVNIALTGRGLIDGFGEPWWDAFNKNRSKDIRPHLVRFVDCRDVLIEGLTFINSPRWTLNPVACDNLTIAKVTIRNPADSPNTDGINPDSCSNVHISNCHIDVGDDCIAIKSGSEEDGRPNPRACQNITVTNCTMLHGHGGVVIGSEMSGGVRNIAISNCVFCGTDRGIRLKSRRGRGNAVEDLRVDNVVMDEVGCPIVLNMFYICGAKENTKLLDHGTQAVNDGTPQFRRLRFSNITARKVKYAAAFMLGLPEMFVDDIVLDGISIYMDSANTDAQCPAMAAGVPEMCRAGLIVKNARNTKLRRIDIYDQLGPAIVINNSQDILVGDLYAPTTSEALVTIDGVDCSTPEEADGASRDGQQIRTFTRGWKLGARRRPRTASEAALSNLAADSK